MYRTNGNKALIKYYSKCLIHIVMCFIICCSLATAIMMTMRLIHFLGTY